MKRMLLFVCAALAVLGCGGDDGNLPSHPDRFLCGSQRWDYPYSVEFCYEGKLYPRCGGKDYNPSTEFCSGSRVYSKCGGRDYNPSVQGCCNNNKIYSIETEICSENSVHSASVKGNSISNYRTVVIGKQTWMAENLDYAVEGSKCYDNNAANCDKYGRLYDWATAMALSPSCNSNICLDQIQSPHRGICPSGWHIPSWDDWNILVYDYVGDSLAGTKLKAASGWKDNEDGSPGNGTDEYGFSALPSKGGDYGNWWIAEQSNDQTSFGEVFYVYMKQDSKKASHNLVNATTLSSVRCVQDEKVSSGKGNSISSYKTVVIGTQTWMAENLDYAVEGSKCLRNSYAYCDEYGRLYDWATAMALPSSCNSSSCSDQIQSPHRGICPSGWHIPIYYDWDFLMNNVGGYSTAGRYLKANSGWNNKDDGSSGNGTDEYGFSALPGGGGNVGYSGYWWSASASAGVNNSYYSAYSQYMYSNSDSAYWGNYSKSGLRSVRCVQDYEKHSGKGNNISNYKTIAIGTQTWMAENFDYVVEGSKCFGNNPAECNAYGSLYDWATAMALPSSCNSSSCASQIQSPHRGICPSGWHIPSRDDWNKLSSYVQSNSGCSSCDARLLKAASGWSNKDDGSSGNGTDQYGFSALPGGDGYSDGSLSNVGHYGYWWSANEYESISNLAYLRYMYYNYDSAYWGIYFKSNLFSVRCVQD